MVGKRVQVALSSIISVIFLISLASVITLPAQSAALTPVPFDINIFKFNDLNGNGVQDPGEPPLAGVQFTVKDSSGSCGGSGGTIGCGVTVCSGATDINGNFVCHIADTTTTIPPYVVTEIPLPGFFSTTPAPPPIFPGSSSSINLVFGDRLPTVITSPISGQVFTTGKVTITGSTDPSNIIDVYWDNCNDNCLVLLGSAAVDPASGKWTFTPIIPFPNNPTTKIVAKALHGGAVVNSATVVFGVLTSTAPSSVGITGIRGTTFDGLPIIYWTSSTTFTIDGTTLCGGTNPTSINLDVGPFSTDTGIVSMAMTPETGNPTIWAATFGPFLPHHGITKVTFTPVCPAGPSTIITFDIYIDPSGTISDACTGLPISGATATLLVDSGGGIFVPASATSPPIIPATNPQTTLADGMFGWEAIPGTYEVTATASGYVAQTTTPLTIPPAVTGLNISLTPVAGCLTPPTITVLGTNHVTVDLGSTYTDAGATATDNSGPVPVTTSGAVNTGLIGTYTITYTASNSAGTTTATRTVNVVAVGTAGQVNGDGKIGKKIEFEFNVKSSDGTKFKGHLDFTDKDKKIELESKTITLLDVSSDKTKSYFTGTGKLNDKSGFTFQMYANDNADGTADSTSITIQDGTGNTVYTNTASLTSGHIEIGNDNDTHDKDNSDDGDHNDNENHDGAGSDHHDNGSNDDKNKHQSS